MVNITIRDKKIGKDAPMMIIAEIASAHEGRFNDLIKLIDFAKETGADAVKFQVLNAESHMTPEHEIWDIVKQLEFSRKQWIKAAEYTRKATNMVLLTDIYDLASVETVKAMNPDMIKIHTADLNNFELVKEAAKINLPTLIGVGASTLDEISKCLHVFRKFNSKVFLALMHGYQGFPTKLDDMNMRQLEMLRQLFQIPVGFLDHSEGDTEESVFIPLVARAIGVFAIEKHIVLDRSLKGIDYESALSMDTFKKLIRKIRLIEKALGSYQPMPLSPGEIRYRSFMKKDIVAKFEIQPSEIITKEKICFKRSAGALPQEELQRVIGKKAKTKIDKNQNINFDLLI